MKNGFSLVTIPCCLLLFPAICMANGGGYAYGVKLTGTVTPFVPQGTEAIQIVDEKLDILLYPGGAKVQVRYALKNVADKKVAVTFGFPVERVRDPDSEAARRPKTPSKHFRDYSVRLDGQPVEARYRIERYGKKGRGLRSIARLLKRIEGWMVSTISFEPRQQRQMLIKYDAAYDERGESVSDDENQQPSKFRYRLSTGAVWRGAIARGTVTVRTLGVHLPWVKIKRPVNRFQKRKGAWIWSFVNLEPTLADDLEIHARPRMDRYAVYQENEQQLSSWYYTWNRKQFHLAHSAYRAKASSELAPHGKKRYVADHLKARGGTWCEGVSGPGVGQTIELVPEEKLPLTALEIIAGHFGSRRLFGRNNRPAALEIVLNDEHRFTARMADDYHEHLIVVRGYHKPVKKVKITIKKVYRGSKYDDTCITQIKLVSKLRSRPKHYGAR